MKELFILLSVTSLCHIIFTQTDIRLPPTLIGVQKKRSILLPKDELTTVKCDAKGTPTVSYVWKRNGVELNTSLLDYINIRDGDLEVRAPALSDEGYYQCIAKNQHGSALSDLTEIRAVFINFFEDSSTPDAVSVAEGQPLRLRCNYSGESSPKPSHYWAVTRASKQFTGKWDRLSLTERIQMDENGDLHFAYIRLEDGLHHVDPTAYCCFISNPYFDDKLGRCTSLKVTQDPAGNVSQSPPTLAFSSASRVVALRGNRVTLRCFFYGNPEPVISWHKSRNSLPLGRHSITVRGLQIHSIKASDNGVYHCNASNAVGSIEHSFRLKVEAAPKFSNPRQNVPHNVNVTEGESVTFNCNATAKPPADVGWFQNGQPIDAENRPERFEFSNDNRSLTIRDVCRDCVDGERQTDLMVIQCNASNVHGYAFVQGYLNVLLRTEVTILGSNDTPVDFLRTREFIFQCLATSDPSTKTTVKWYKTETQEEIGEEDPYAYKSKGFLVIKFDSKCPAVNCSKYLGAYRCDGFNGYSPDNRTIYISYRNHFTPPPAEFKMTWSLWKIILVAGAFAFVFLLIGSLLGFQSHRRFCNVRSRMKRRIVPPPPPSPPPPPPRLNAGVSCASDGIPTAEERNNDRSMASECSLSANGDYASIDKVSGENDRDKGGPTSRPTDSPTYTRYESIHWPHKEAGCLAVPNRNGNSMYDDVGCSDAQEELRNRGKRNRQAMSGYESLSSDEKFSNSSVQPDEAHTYLKLSPTEVSPYVNLNQNEVGCYMDMNKKNTNSSLEL